MVLVSIGYCSILTNQSLINAISHTIQFRTDLCIQICSKHVLVSHFFCLPFWHSIAYSIFYPYRGMDDQIFKNQYILERMIWLWNPLELILSWFDPSEKWYLKKRLSLPPQRLLCWFTPWKNILWVEPPEKIIIKGPSRLLGSYPCMDKKCNSSILLVAGNVLILIQE